MSTNSETIPSKPLPSWTTFPIKQFPKGFKGCQSVLMGDYMIILAHDSSSQESQEEVLAHDNLSSESQDDDSSSESEHEEFKPSVLFAIDLRDNSIGEVKMRDFPYHQRCTFTKYGENQIFKLGTDYSFAKDLGDLYQITIESFKPLKVSYKKIPQNNSFKNYYDSHTLQVYENAMYAYACNDRSLESCNLLKFDLTKLEWELLETNGEHPDLMFSVSSFLIEDNLFIYGKEQEPEDAIFALNLKSLTWKKFEQQIDVGEEIELRNANIHGDIYKGNLLITEKRKGDNFYDNFVSDFDYESDGPDTDELYCWNIESNSWSTHTVQKSEIPTKRGRLNVYQDLLLTTSFTGDKLSLDILDLQRLVELPAPESPEQKHLKSLFLSEQESDIKFRIQDKIIPAHKQVLIEKSKYFAGLFNSGMVESRQEVIDIKDCEYATFKEFLRFLYCGHLELDADLAIKLFHLSDIYVRDDINQRCIHHLQHNITSENVYAILDFAFQQGFSLLVTWCLYFFRNRLNMNNVSDLVRYLDNQTNSEYVKEILELRKRAVTVITYGYITNLKKEEEKRPFYMDFLIRSVEMGTLHRLILFSWTKIIAKSDDELNQASFEIETSNLRKKICSFVQENFTNLKANKILDNLPSSFWLDFASMILEKPDKEEIKENPEERQANNKEETKGRKRMEPVETEEAKPELKKTKK